MNCILQWWRSHKLQLAHSPAHQACIVLSTWCPTVYDIVTNATKLMPVAGFSIFSGKQPAGYELHATNHSWHIS
jgi:hypothetical protein